jgi:lauroyl/myristoyl acyltransferase
LPGNPRGAVAIDCFGLKTSVTSAHGWLHERTGVPIIPAHCEPLRDGRYRLIFHPKINATVGMTHQEIAQACWNWFEPYVPNKPARWPWMYKHWRYPSGLIVATRIFSDHSKTCFNRTKRSKQKTKSRHADKA